VTIIKLAE